jgi:hypothetical protein
MKLSCIASALAIALTGCSMEPVASMPPQTTNQREAQIDLAGQAVMTGSFAQGERLMADYLYRGKDDELLFKSVGVSSESKKKAIDTVALLLWETGRDMTLEKFANRYLSGYERDSMLCRLAERNAVYEKAYNCWNGLGDVDRARRSIRTESALRILKD